MVVESTPFVRSSKNQIRLIKYFAFQETLELKYIKKCKSNLENFAEIKDYILENGIDLIIVGPEKPLVDGIVDYLEKFNIKFLDLTR